MKNNVDIVKWYVKDRSAGCRFDVQILQLCGKDLVYKDMIHFFSEAYYKSLAEFKQAKFFTRYESVFKDLLRPENVIGVTNRVYKIKLVPSKEWILLDDKTGFFERHFYSELFCKGEMKILFDFEKKMKDFPDKNVSGLSVLPQGTAKEHITNIMNFACIQRGARLFGDDFRAFVANELRLNTK